MISLKNAPSHPPAGAGASASEAGRSTCSELRCGCGSLLAKLVEGAVELKCRRCKRTWRIPLEPGG